MIQTKKAYFKNFSWFQYTFSSYAWLCALAFLHRLLRSIKSCRRDYAKNWSHFIRKLFECNSFGEMCYLGCHTLPGVSCVDTLPILGSVLSVRLAPLSRQTWPACVYHWEKGFWCFTFKAYMWFNRAKWVWIRANTIFSFLCSCITSLMLHLAENPMKIG